MRLVPERALAAGRFSQEVARLEAAGLQKGEFGGLIRRQPR